MALTNGETNQLKKFRIQYLQILDLDRLNWPPPTTLRKADAQLWIFRNLFDRTQQQYLPNDRYQIRVLKRIISRIEDAIADPDEDVRTVTHCKGLTLFIITTLCSHKTIWTYESSLFVNLYSPFTVFTP